MIEKCFRFKRNRPPGKKEEQLCTATNTSVECAGFSEFCSFPDNFESVRGIPKNQITFTQRPAEEILSDLRNSWNK